jgi:hypothetical protein
MMWPGMARIDEMAAMGGWWRSPGSPAREVFWNGDVRRFRPPPVGNRWHRRGDVFAAAFFYRLHTTRTWEAARFANHLASCSVTRTGLDSIPTREEVLESMVEVF